LWAALEVVGEDGYVLGIDLAPAMVELTKRDLERQGVRNGEIRVGDVEHLDLDDESFDVVTCGFAVFFFPALDLALAECRRVLRAGGRFAASTFADGMLDYPWLPEILEGMGLMDTLRNQRGGDPLLRSLALEHALISGGFDQVATTTARRRFVFADLDAYLLWVRSHAFGRIVSELSDADLRHFQHECTRRLHQHQTGDGYELLKVVDVTTGRRS
jgi:O-methyltransferase/aklanonic acid methyltransferase